MYESTNPGLLPTWATRVECIKVACSNCGRTSLIYDTGGDIHYCGPDEARQDLLGEDASGWSEVGADLYCRECTARRFCEEIGGHDIRTFAHSTRPGLEWYCGRDYCPASGMIRSDDHKHSGELTHE